MVPLAHPHPEIPKVPPPPLGAFQLFAGQAVQLLHTRIKVLLLFVVVVVVNKGLGSKFYTIGKVKL